MDATQEIYDADPRKVAPARARKAIANAVARISARFDGDADAAAAWLLERVQRYAGSPHVRATLARERNFVPHPATWFNAESYDEDDVEWGRKPQRDMPSPAEHDAKRRAALEPLLDDLRAAMAAKTWSDAEKARYVRDYIERSVPAWLRDAPEIQEFTSG